MKSTTQILKIRWQDRAWKPRIRRTVDRERLMKPVDERVITKQVVTDASRPCRQGAASRSLVQRVFLAFLPRRRD